MSDIRERNTSDKIKGKISRQLTQGGTHQPTAKFRKDRLHGQKEEGENSTSQAIDQVEDMTRATADEVRGQVVQQIETQVPKAIFKARQTIKAKGQQRIYTQNLPITVDNQATSSTITPPTPQERMRRKLVAEHKAHKEQTAHDHYAPEPTTTEVAPIDRQPHYGHAASPTPTSPPKHSFSLNQSIHPSIHPSPKERPPITTKVRGRAPNHLAIKTYTSAQAIKSTRPSKGKPTPPKKLTKPKKIPNPAKKKAQRQAQQKMLQTTQKSAQTAAELSKKAVVAVGKAVAQLVSALAGLIGGTALVVILCILIIMGAIVASPFGLLFTDQPSQDAVPLNVAVSQVNMDLWSQLKTLQTGNYDSITLQGQVPDWSEVIAVFASKTAGAEDGITVATMTDDRVDLLKEVFWDMCIITHEVESIQHAATDTTSAWTEYILHITITTKTAEEMRTEYGFTDYQNQALTELLAEGAVLGGLLTSFSVTDMDALAILSVLPDDLDPDRIAILKTACTLVGKVNYFWGGKSLVTGWDSRWGQIYYVSAAESTTSDMYLPYGLDCSGYVDWVFYNALDYTIGHGGGATAQYGYCHPIDWDEATPGDLVFYPDFSHIGIYAGEDEAGEPLIIHCSMGYNNVVITGQEGFTLVGRPDIYG